MTRPDVAPRFPASLRLASLLKAIAWIVSSLAALLLLLTLAGAGLAPIGLAISIGVACYAVFNHLVLYAAAEGLIIAVAVEQNTRTTADLLQHGFQSRSAMPQSGAGAGTPQTETFHSLGPVGDAIIGLSSKSAIEREAAAERIGQLGPKGRTAIYALEIAVNDPDPRVRTRAQWALDEVRRGG